MRRAKDDFIENPPLWSTATLWFIATLGLGIITGIAFCAGNPFALALLVLTVLAAIITVAQDMSKPEEPNIPGKTPHSLD